MRRLIGSHGNVVRSICVSAALTMPLLEGREAKAQSTVNVPYQVTGPQGYNVTLSSSNGTIPAYYVSTTAPVVSPSIRMEGPGTLSLRVYPIIGSDPNRPTRQYPFRYTLDGVAREQQLSTSINSGFSHPTLSRNTEIGAPSEVRIEVAGAGPHTIIPTYPTSCFEVVSSTAPAPPVVRAPLPIEPVVPVPVAPPVVVRPPVIPAPSYVLPSLPSFTGNLMVNVLFGSPTDVVSFVDLQYQRRINDKLGFSVGAYGGVDLTGLTLPDRQTSLTLPWFSAIGGINYTINRAHRLGVLGFVGYQSGSSETTGNNRTVNDSEGAAAFGLRAFYENRYLVAMIEGSSRFADVGRLQVGVRIPRTWVSDVSPVVSISARLLRTPTFDSAAQRVDLNQSGNAFAFGILGTIPLYRFGSVVPSLHVGGEVTTSGVFGFTGGLRVDVF